MTSASQDVSISVITATYNADNHLPKLIECLENQADKDFQWIVADGGSTDATLQLLEEVNDLNITVSSQSDFGIYDGLNRAIKLSDSDYYIVIGADDILFSNAIADYRRTIIETNAEIITSQVVAGGRVLTTHMKPSWLYGQFAFITAHSVGVMFKKSLHEKFGYYSNKFPIAADQLFVKQACQGGASRYEAKFISGEFFNLGTSSNDIVGTLSEFFRVQLLTEKHKYLQIFIFIFRLLKNSRKIKNSIRDEKI